MTSDRRFRTTPLEPFGLRVVAAPDVDLTCISASAIHDWISEHHLAVLRGFSVPPDDTLVKFCERLGDLMRWDFGVINELRVRADAQNYLYTNRAVPFHCDGAFAGTIPHYIFFHCQLAPHPEGGGETLFCDTTRAVQRVSADELETWRGITVTYSTEKLAHYGGTFSSPIVARHAKSHETILRFAEPVEDVNPVRLQFDGLSGEDADSLLRRLHALLRDEGTCYKHTWRDNDVVIADNHYLLHGRNAFRQPTARHLRRINIL